MKKLTYILIMLFSIVTFSQEKKSTLDKKINTTLDSLSKIYKKKVVGYGYTSYRGVKETTIRYLEKGKEIKKIIKTEIVGKPRKEDE